MVQKYSVQAVPDDWHGEFVSLDAYQELDKQLEEATQAIAEQKERIEELESEIDILESDLADAENKT